VGGGRVGGIRRWSDQEDICVVFHAGEAPVQAPVPLPEGLWGKLLDSAEVQWGGPGSAISDAIASKGEVEMELAPFAFLVLAKRVSER
jgi:maltooligosyltrehalose trehalohydrolase